MNHSIQIDEQGYPYITLSEMQDKSLALEHLSGEECFDKFHFEGTVDIKVSLKKQYVHMSPLHRLATYINQNQ